MRPKSGPGVVLGGNVLRCPWLEQQSARKPLSDIRGAGRAGWTCPAWKCTGGRAAGAPLLAVSLLLARGCSSARPGTPAGSGGGGHLRDLSAWGGSPESLEKVCTLGWGSPSYL